MKDRLTLEEHNKLGPEVFSVTNALVKLNQMILVRYPHNHGLCRSVHAARTAVSSLQCMLDSEWSDLAPREQRSPYYAQYPGPLNPEASK